jgi:hypothetical protein
MNQILLSCFDRQNFEEMKMINEQQRVNINLKFKKQVFHQHFVKIAGKSVLSGS